MLFTDCLLKWHPTTAILCSSPSAQLYRMVISSECYVAEVCQMLFFVYITQHTCMCVSGYADAHLFVYVWCISTFVYIVYMITIRLIET